MTEQNTPFTPDWVLPPGETVLEMTQERGWTQAELAQRLGYSEKHVSQLIKGKVSITLDAAQRLERVLGSTLDFWLALETHYRKHIARLNAEKHQMDWAHWLDELPIKELMANGILEKKRLTEKTRPGLVQDCLRFFGVASPDEWRTRYVGMQVAFRRSSTATCHIGAISAWLRLGEQQAEKQDCPSYNRERFEKALGHIRRLTCQPPDIFGPQMRQLLHEAGVCFVLVPSIPRARVSGVARWLSSTRPLIQLSLYGKANDRFWFTFFHEAAHILLHASSQKDKDSIFLDDPDSTHADDDQREREANAWAQNWLIPPQYTSNLASTRTRDAVIKLARQIDIHPGIVVGRLQHEGVIPAAWLNDLKQSLQPEDIQGQPLPSNKTDQPGHTEDHLH